MPAIVEIVLSNAAVATVLALLAAGIGKVCRRPALAHGLWLLVLLKLVTPPIIPVPTGWTLSESSNAATLGIESGNEEIAGIDGNGFSDESIDLATCPEPQRGAFAARPALAIRAGGSDPQLLTLRTSELASNPRPLTPISSPPRGAGLLTVLIPLWLTGSVLALAWIIWHSYRFHRLLRFAQPAPNEGQKQVQDLARRLGLKRCPVLYLVSGAISPMIWGFPPRLLFPARLLERLDRDQRATILVHELAHLKRRDHWVRILELIALALYWWHPAVWWARRELHETEEQCCDAWVVWALSDRSRTYALALLYTVDFFSHARPTLPLAASGIGPVPHLRRRLTMIMQERTPRSMTWAGCVAVLAVGLLLPLAPVLGQPAPEKPKDSQSNKDERDQQIETLKKAIKILEDQKNVERRNQYIKQLNDVQKDEEKTKEIYAAAEVAAQLGKQVEAKRKELKDLEAKLSAAKQRLIKLTTERDQSRAPLHKHAPLYKQIDLQLNPVTVPYRIESEHFQMPEFKVYDAQIDPIKTFEIQWAPDPSQPVKLEQKAATPDKKSDLEQKVEKLLKEVEELKRELQKHKQADAPKKQ